MPMCFTHGVQVIVVFTENGVRVQGVVKGGGERVCVCVCVCVCMSDGGGVCVCVCMLACVYALVLGCVCPCMHVFKHTSVC